MPPLDLQEVKGCKDEDCVLVLIRGLGNNCSESGQMTEILLCAGEHSLEMRSQNSVL